MVISAPCFYFKLYNHLPDSCLLSSRGSTVLSLSMYPTSFSWDKFVLVKKSTSCVILIESSSTSSDEVCFILFRSKKTLEFQKVIYKENSSSPAARYILTLFGDKPEYRPSPHICLLWCFSQNLSRPASLVELCRSIYEIKPTIGFYLKIKQNVVKTIRLRQNELIFGPAINVQSTYLSNSLHGYLCRPTCNAYAAPYYLLSALWIMATQCYKQPWTTQTTSAAKTARRSGSTWTTDKPVVINYWINQCL